MINVSLGALGVVVESPQRSEDLQRMTRPLFLRERPNPTNTV